MLQKLLADKHGVPALFPYESGAIGEGQVRVQSRYGAPKHGTELTEFVSRTYITETYDNSVHMFVPTKPSDRPDFYGLGNMWVGQIIEKSSDVSGFELGEQVAGYGNLATDHIVHATELRKTPERMSWQEAVCFDPMQFALGGIRDANLRIGDAVLISGLGAIGQMAAQAARVAGASLVFVADPIEIRRQAALENGADRAFDPTREDMGAIIRQYTDNRGVDVVIETSANYMAVEQGIRALAYRGTMAMVGRFKECHIPFNFGREGHFNQQNLVFSLACNEPNRDYPNWNFDRIMQEAWRLVSSGCIRCDNIVQPVVNFADCAEAYHEYIVAHPEKSIKLGVIHTQ